MRLACTWRLGRYSSLSLMWEGIQLGLGVALQWQYLLYLVGGCVVGTFIGLLPGLGPMTAIAIMIPVASALEPAAGIIMMAAVYYGAIFGGSTSAILINAPALPWRASG